MRFALHALRVIAELLLTLAVLAVFVIAGNPWIVVPTIASGLALAVKSGWCSVRERRMAELRTTAAALDREGFYLDAIDRDRWRLPKAGQFEPKRGSAYPAGSYARVEL